MPEAYECSDENLNQPVDEASTDKLPSVLRNWQVIEIDGEATRIADEPVAEDAAVAVREGAIRDHPDDVIVASLDTRALLVNAGETATLQISLLNNGEHTARFTLYVEGWVKESWIAVTSSSAPMADESLPLHLRLDQGERTTIHLTLTPPRASAVSAGEYAFAVVVRTSEDPERFNRLAATLRLNPYVDFTLGQIRPQPLAFSWFRRAHSFVLPLANRSNTPLTLRLQALDAQRQWQVELGAMGSAKHQARVTLQPGQKVQAPVRVRARALALFGVDKQSSELRLSVTPVAEASSPRMAKVTLTRAPLLGPWHLVALFSLCVTVIMGVSLLGITGLMLWHSSMAARANQVVPVPTPAILPMIALVVNVPAPAQAPLAPVGNAAEQSPQTGQTDAQLPNGESTPATPVPMVRADQVTGPGTPAPVAQAQAPVVQAVAPRPAPTHKLTYQQMFQEIGRRYDLNWRMLAAQAYVESSFDSAALGRTGTLGLMQVMPATWREWAPTVKATDPFDTYGNVLVAAVYLDYLRTTLGKHGHPQVEWVLVAYNWGIDKVLKHLDNNLGWDDLPKESRQYAQDILRVAETIPAH